MNNIFSLYTLALFYKVIKYCSIAYLKKNIIYLVIFYFQELRLFISLSTNQSFFNIILKISLKRNY